MAFHCHCALLSGAKYGRGFGDGDEFFWGLLILLGIFLFFGQIHPRKRHPTVAFAACFPGGWNEEEAAV
jgi:hypothetical protein